MDVLVTEPGDGQSVVYVAHHATSKELLYFFFKLNQSVTYNMTQKISLFSHCSSSLYISSCAVSTRTVLVAVDQARDEIRGHADDQPVGNDGQHPDGLQHVNPHT